MKNSDIRFIGLCLRYFNDRREKKKNDKQIKPSEGGPGARVRCLEEALSLPVGLATDAPQPILFQ